MDLVQVPERPPAWGVSVIRAGESPVIIATMSPNRPRVPCSENHFATVGGRLALARHDAGLSQRVVADVLGVSTRWLSRRERNQSRLDFSDGCLLGRIYGVSFMEFYPDSPRWPRKTDHLPACVPSPDDDPTKKEDPNDDPPTRGGYLVYGRENGGCVKVCLDRGEVRSVLEGVRKAGGGIDSYSVSAIEYGALARVWPADVFLMISQAVVSAGATTRKATGIARRRAGAVPPRRVQAGAGDT
jgi:transcriptional regulator with XRE-family HTH domain